MSLQEKSPIILASGSHARQQMLKNAGITYEAIPADIDENKILSAMRSEAADVSQIALELAKAKALHVSTLKPGAYTIGSDQILECEGQLFQKARTKDEAREKLKTLSGNTHTLISSVVVSKESKMIWSHTDTVKLTMHNLDDQFIEEYIESAGDDIFNCVGAYAFENHGAWLFSSIDGNYFTILGMPFLPLLAFLREKG